MKYLIPLFIILLILKLAGAVTWAWWIICIPLMAVGVIGLIIFIFYFITVWQFYSNRGWK